MSIRRIGFAALILTLPLPAQEVAMERRRGTGARLEAPYTLAVETPHVKWAKPLPGGPIRLLAVPTVSEGRTLAELAQRLSLELTTVSIDPAFDVNKWTMGFGRDYGARADPNDFSLLYSYLEEELTSAKPFDAVLIQLSHGWDALTPNSREALLRRVREGAGLVLIRPGDDQISPLRLSAPVSPPTRFRGVEIPSSPASSWKRTAPHYITRAIPVESFPFEYLQEYSYKPASGAEVLIQSGAGNPILAVRPFGKGRVVAFGYDNTGLAWSMPMSASGFVSDLYWEYFYAMLCRSLVFAAGREPAAGFTPALWRLKSLDGTVIRSGKGKPPSFSKLGPGRYFVEEQSETDWNVSAIDVPQPLKIEALKSSLEIIREGDSVEASWNPLPEPAVAELVDGLGRVIARATSATNKVALKAGRPLTHSGFLRVAAGSATAQVPVQFAASSREGSDYEIIMPWYGPRGYHPWIPALDEQFRKIGVTTLANPGRNFRLIASAGLHDIFGVYGYRDQNYRKRKAAYAETKDKAHLTRDVILQSPGFEADLRRQMTERLARLAALGPLAYYIADESSLTSYTDPFDVDWSSESLAAFRQWLHKEYPSLDALNTSWGTTFSSWEAVVPMTTEEAQKHGNFAPWADHRAFMEQDFVRVLDLAARITHEIDSGALASISGTQVSTAHNGCNWYEIDPSGKLVRAYSSNVTILGGRAAFHIPFALNDSKGRWTVKARDVVSGLTAVGRCSPRTEP